MSDLERRFSMKEMKNSAGSGTTLSFFKHARLRDPGFQDFRAPKTLQRGILTLRDRMGCSPVISGVLLRLLSAVVLQIV